MGGHKARVYYDLEGMPHTWVRLASPDGKQEDRGFGPTVFSPAWKGSVKNDSDHEWTLFREYNITEKQYDDMKRVINDWEGRNLEYIFGQRDCRYLVHDVMAKRGGYEGAAGYGFNDRSRIAFTVEGCLSIFKELAEDQELVSAMGARIRSQGSMEGLFDVPQVLEAFESGYWPGPYGPEEDNFYGPSGMMSP